MKNLGLVGTVDLAKNAVPKSSITQYSGNSDKLLMSQQVVTSLIDERVTKTEFQKLLNTKVETGWINKNFLEKNPKELEDINLQDVLEQGWYCQRWSVNSTPERNYPIQEFGMLEVLPSDSYDTWFVQRFTAGHSLNTYVRKIIKNDQSKDLVAATEWKRYLMTSENISGVISDVNGNLRQSSPIIQVYPTGTFITNDESEGASVSRIDIGQYKVTGIMGYNSDGAWGIHGGISSPKNNNGLELIYISDKVQKDGSIIIETFHRQHLHLPEQFQNKRIKTMFEGKLIYYAEGEPCDIPDGCRLDVRVQMPKDSVWNLKQNKLHKKIENSEE
ncbi:pyocin knob domain-containing protein [Xenorhabdus eapokensis]|uniref:Phage tail protein C-terminal domain-containing protein n=1 Tax=Xenorhabdus eapokensis TaxID=1873482 RepID=A0A1Q5TLW4_9GAMM|nr:pyocin knob domain-containing protein [Xenorhabdus eapokensis]OKP01220.1 hypothetical protein Xedl_02954 [Xenorhabdus eapokensis]